MQNPVGEVVSMPVPQGLPASTSFHDNQHQPVTMDTTASIATVSMTTQIEEAHSTTNNVNICQTAAGEGDRDKKAIYRHPLFPLMALLLEKCEQATQTPDCPSSDSFDVDIQAFVHRQEQERRPFFSDDLELDGLMVKAIQVLRIHLLELEKVSELCKDFCSRYISCLKGKLQSENLLRTDIHGFESDGADDCLLSPGRSTTNNNNNNNNSIQLMQNSNVNLVIQGNVAQPSSNPVPMGTLGQGQVVSGGTVYQMVQTPQGLVAQPIQIQSQTQTPSTPAIHGSTPLSQIGLQNSPGDVPSQHSPTTPSLPKDFNFDDDDYSKRKNKRGILPKQATQVMKSWLFQHIVHPYPTEDEKRHIAGQTNLTLLQVNNWFINARRRILQPMLDASNPEGAKVKKSKPQQNRPVQRFWPENLANLQPQSTNSASNMAPSSPSSSQSPTSTSSPQAKLQVVLEEDDEDRDMEEEDDEDELEETDATKMNFSNGMMSSHSSTVGHQIVLQSGGAVSGLVQNNQYLQPSTDVSSTSSSAATLNLIADVAMGGIQNTNFLPLISTNQNLSGVLTPMPSLRNDTATNAGASSDSLVKHDGLQLGVAEASSLMQ